MKKLKIQARCFSVAVQGLATKFVPFPECRAGLFRSDFFYEFFFIGLVQNTIIWYK